MSCILIAEDDPHILRVISLWLSRQGHEIIETRNGNDAWARFQEHQPEILLTDVNMPGMDGLALLDLVLASPGKLRGVVVLTNRHDHAEIRERLSAAAVHVLPKPFSPSGLSELIQSLLSGVATSG